MHKYRTLLCLSLSLAAMNIVLHSMFVFGQASFAPSTEPGWRRTNIGWEQADSLPIRNLEDSESSVLEFPALSLSIETVHHTHRLALPIAITGFIACFGSWVLLHWPTTSREV
ncbi:MAG: hypothetical protein SGI77_20930 [Pirellulaceae bacterium]|nr:hypothetical protein [Pirellulaceae bacterium]